MSSYGRGGYGGRGGDDYMDRGGGSTDEMMVPARDVGKIIGRGGKTIREMQEQSQCTIKVSQDDEGDGTRRVELSGSDGAIDMAKELIHRVLESGDDRGGQRQSYQGGGGGGGGADSSREIVQVDSSFVGRIIGKRGMRIRELQDETGCRINVSRDGGNYGQTDVELVGSRSQIDRARIAIDEIVSQAY